MILRLTGMAALIACLGMAGAQIAQAQRQHEYQAIEAYGLEPTEGEAFASYGSFDAGGCNSCESGGGSCCSDGSCGGGGSYGGGGSSVLEGLFSRPGRFFVGVDYLNIRSTFSESTAFVTSTGGTPLPGSPLLFPPVVNTFNELEYDYESSYRIYGGYRLCDCGGEIRFAFTRFNSSATADSGAVPLPSGGQSTQFLSPNSGDLVVTNVGDRLLVNSNVNANIYDLDFARTIPLGSPADGGCGSCVSSCDSGCGWCPAWDLRWSAGLRFADVNWDRRTVRQSLTPALNGENASTTMNFQGGGIRVGLEGTRYIGRRQRFAVFARSNVSLLLGEVQIEHIDDSASTPTPDITTRFNSTQLIPVLDLEAGGRIFVTDRLMVSAGYLFSAWHDLGMRDTFDVLAGRGPTFDDANILGFDGLFARAELTF